MEYRKCNKCNREKPYYDFYQGIDGSIDNYCIECTKKEFEISQIINKANRTNEIIEKYKEKMCPFCIHNKDTEYQECNIVIQIDGQADCVNYKCDEYCRKRKK